MLLSIKSGTFGVDSLLHPAILLISYLLCSNLSIITNKWIIDTAVLALILVTVHLSIATIITQLLKYTTNLIPSPGIPIKWGSYTTILIVGSLYTLSYLDSNIAFLTLSVSFISMLKGLAPITTLIITWCAALTEPSTSKLVSTAIIALGVLLSSLGEVSFSRTGFMFQLMGIAAESAYLVLIQWLLAAHKDNTQQNPQRTTTPDNDTGLAINSSSSSSSSKSGHESDAGEVGAEPACCSDGNGGSTLPTHGHGASRTSRDDNGQDRDDEGDIAKIGTLGLIYYYAPIWALLAGLAALIVEAPEINWKGLNGVEVGTLALSGGLAFLSNLTSIFLIGKVSALTMSTADILKSLLLVVASVVIWTIPIPLLQSIGYAISLAGMLYYALPAESEPHHFAFMACLRRCTGRSKGGQSQTWFRHVWDRMRELCGYRVPPVIQDTDQEGSVPLEKIYEGK